MLCSSTKSAVFGAAFVFGGIMYNAEREERQLLERAKAFKAVERHALSETILRY
jgi:hypothetical protein